MKRLIAIVALCGALGLVALLLLQERSSSSPGGEGSGSPQPPGGAGPTALLATGGGGRRVKARALARIEAWSEEIGVASDITGRIVEILVDEGQVVEPGAPLVRLDPSVYQARADAARAALLQAEAQRDLLVAGARSEEIELQRQLLEETRASERLARASWERVKQLIEEGIISKTAADEAREEHEAATARVKAAQERLGWTEKRTRKEELRAAEAAVAVERHQLAVAESELDRTVLRAPIAGTITRRLRRVGEAVSSFQIEPVVRIADMTQLRARAEVDEVDIGKVRLGQAARIEVLSQPEIALEGKVSLLGKVMGRKKTESNDPNEREDVRVLEVLVDIEKSSDAAALGATSGLPLGLRVTVSFLE